MKLKRISAIILILIVISSCALEKRSKRIFFAMGNIPVEVILYSKENPDFEKVFNEIENEIKKLDSLFSKYSTISAVYIFNESEKSSYAPQELIELVMISDSIRKMTNNLFDIRIETLLSYYERCEKEQLDLSEDSIKYFVSIMKKDSVFIKNDSIYKSNSALKIDFGGIAKGYFGDISIEIMRKNNFRKGIINLGGQIIALNEIDSRYFKIGIRSPDRDSVVRVDSILNGSISTSGVYFRYYEIKGKKYCHIINPLTGIESEGIRSVTVKANTGAVGDAYSTAIMLMNENEREAFLKMHKEITAYIQK